jgi:hypothetical protein
VWVRCSAGGNAAAALGGPRAHAPVRPHARNAAPAGRLPLTLSTTLWHPSFSQLAAYTTQSLPLPICLKFAKSFMDSRSWPLVAWLPELPSGSGAAAGPLPMLVATRTAACHGVWLVLQRFAGEVALGSWRGPAASGCVQESYGVCPKHSELELETGDRSVTHAAATRPPARSYPSSNRKKAAMLLLFLLWNQTALDWTGCRPGQLLQATVTQRPGQGRRRTKRARQGTKTQTSPHKGRHREGQFARIGRCLHPEAREGRECS